MMGWTWYDREIAEKASQEMLDDLTDAEIAEMERRQQAERETDFWDAAWSEMRAADEALGD